MVLENFFLGRKFARLVINTLPFYQNGKVKRHLKGTDIATAQKCCFLNNTLTALLVFCDFYVTVDI